MYKELIIYDKNITLEEARNQLFSALRYGMKGICVSPYFLNPLKELVPHGTVLSCPINFPDGIGDFKVTQHSILSTIRKGANAIDLVIHPNPVSDNKWEVYLDEIPCYLRICKENNASLRVMLEYRIFSSEEIISLAGLLADMGVEYVFPSTGYFADDFSDNLMISALLQQKYYSINVICTAQVWRQAQYDEIVRSKVFGLRFHKASVLETLGV